MKQLILVIFICITIILILALILAFWDLPVEQSIKTVILSNEDFIN